MKVYCQTHMVKVYVHVHVEGIFIIALMKVYMKFSSLAFHLVSMWHSVAVMLIFCNNGLSLLCIT